MFGRYTDQCKRAVFFAQQTALSKGATAIDPIHLLLGLISEKKTRSDTIFHLCELFPEETAQQTSLVKQKVIKGTIPLTQDGKRVVAYTARVANGLHDYWIDTEHMVLGILREGENAAAEKLRSVGLDIQAAQQRVIESKGSRPPRPNPVLFWARRHPLGVALPTAFVLGVIAALYFLGVIGAR